MFLEDLGCYVLSRIARGHKEPVFCTKLLGKAKINDSDVVGIGVGIHVDDV